MFKALALILSGLCFFTARAQEQDAVLKQIDLASITVNALGIPSNRFDFGGMVGTIDSTTLVLTDPTLIAFELNRISGVLMQSGTLTTNRIVIRGVGSRSPFGTNKIRAYFGEIPLTDGRGETTIEDIDLSFLGNVEVQKGPNSSLYGAGLGGVILLGDRQAKQSEISTTVGSFGLYRLGVSLGLGSTNSKGSIGVQHQQADGFRQNNASERKSIMGTWHWQLPKTDIQLISMTIYQKAYIPSSIGESAFNKNPTMAATNWYESAGYEQYTRGFNGVSISHRLSEKLTYYGSAAFLWKNNYEPRPFNILQDNQTGGSTRSRISATWGYIRMQAGFELFTDAFTWGTFENLYQNAPSRKSIKGDRLSDNRDTRTFLNTFVQSEIAVTPSTLFTVGLNRNSTVQTFEDRFANGEKQTKKYPVIYSPRLSLVQSITPEINAFASVSDGFSPPSVEETLNEDQTFNGHIRHETGWNREIGIKGAHRHISYELAAYSMHINDLLVTRRTAADVTFGTNAGRTIHNGLEADFRVLLLAGKDNQLTSAISYAYNSHRFGQFENNGIVYAGNQLTGVPKGQGTFGLDWAGRTWLAGLLGQYVGAMPITDDNAVFSDAYQLLHMYVGARLALGKNTLLRLSYRINNVLDAHYASMLSVNAQGFGSVEPRYYYPGAPRNHQVTVVLQRK
jgi:iron complex outermembrane receptor protein